MNLLQDFTLAARSLRAHRGTTAFVVLTLALGLAAFLSTHAVLDAVLWKSLPYPQADALRS